MKDWHSESRCLLIFVSLTGLSQIGQCTIGTLWEVMLVRRLIRAFGRRDFGKVQNTPRLEVNDVQRGGFQGRDHSKEE